MAATCRESLLLMKMSMRRSRFAESLDFVNFSAVYIVHCLIVALCLLYSLSMPVVITVLHMLDYFCMFVSVIAHGVL